ncbi:MAG: AMP-binding protein, partial [bacterium]|nr:AMP-binding protein [bacterium]
GVQNPFFKKGFGRRRPPGRGTRLYRTGDLARWLLEGDIEFLGRVDRQVKVRGKRVELGEIENRLLNHQNIKEAIVAAKEDETGDRRLCAYVVFHTPTDEWETLKGYLSAMLPDYMIPSYFVSLERIPLTPGGKVDYGALPEPVIEAGKDYSAPGDETERRLVKIWSEVLQLREEAIGIHANFFGLGGHSLRATILTSVMHKEFNVNIPLAQVFKTATVKGLAQYIRETRKEQYLAVEPTGEKDWYPLSSAQKRLYFLQVMELRGTGYNMPQALELKGEIDGDKLEHTFRRLVRRHESLRTSFEVIEEEPVQRISDEVEFEIEFRVKGESLQDFVRPFDLSRAPLLRVGLIPIADHHYLLMVDLHHIVSDGASMRILIEEFMAIYQGRHLVPLALQYKDYSDWQNRYDRDRKEIIKRQEDYWLNQFTGQLPLLSLPMDYPRPAVRDFEGSRETFELSVQQTQGLKALSLNTGATLYMVLLSVINIWLSKLGGQEDIIVGAPTAGRRHDDLQGIVGMFVNTLALRNYPRSRHTVESFVREVKTRTLDSFENQEFQFEDLVDRVLDPVSRDAGRNPLFDVMFQLETLYIPVLEIPGLKLTPYETGHKVSKFDMILLADEVNHRLYFAVEYSTRLFKAGTIRRFSEYFKRIVSAVVEQPRVKLMQIEIISEKEKRQVIIDFNDTETAYPKHKTLHRLFEEQAAGNPHRAALVGKMTTKEDAFITYGQLNEKSNQLALVLKEKGVVVNTIVAIMVERSIEMIIGIFGILKAGGAYLPIDPDYPEER